MKYTVDRIEDNIVVLENRLTQEIININKEYLPSSIHEGSILIYENNEYKELKEEELSQRKKIEERFKRLRSN